MNETSRTITVTLEVRELFFDIMNKTYLTGRSRGAENPGAYEVTSHMEVSADDENSYQIRRSITNAYGDLKTELAEYYSQDDEMTDNRIREAVDNDGQLLLHFNMPSNFNPAAREAVVSGVHQYIVNRAIADWFTITNKADAPEYVALAAQALNNARRAFYKRRRPIRPDYTTPTA